MSRTLCITNDFPPRVGGIQSFVHSLASQLPPDQLVVYASRYEGAEAFDKAQPFPVVRHPTSLLLPTRGALHRARAIAKEYACDSVWFGAAAPLGLLAGPLRRDPGIARFVASTHGHEVGWAKLPVARQLLARIGRECDIVTYLGEFTRQRLAAACGPETHFEQLPSGVDTEAFSPSADGEGIRRRYGLTDRPVVVCVSRLVARKGQDVLIRALPEIRRRVPGAALLLVGGGPHRKQLEEMVREGGHGRDVVFSGSVPFAELPAHYAAGHVFAMPCRSRLGGLEVEGLGIVYLEANACGLPVVAGDSGGAPDAVLEDVTGHVVDGRRVAEVAARVSELLEDDAKRIAMGSAGREWVSREWRWPTLGARLQELLQPV
ncbi:MAG TPA: glycosyltransferase family 4 protein [Frankiaceae bacterium]|jgi:phosphatidylinositol alpha-1,6-mannosyltransferase|nr:glycosyltransferase family 4 protein [Frankiaceae bacterium]